MRTSSSTGSTVPTSLLASMVETIVVRSLASPSSSRSSASRSRCACASTGMRTTSKPNHSCSHAADWATAGCSIAEMIMRGRQFAGCLPSASANPQTGRKPSLRMRAMAMPLMARLSDSVPPEVKITSSGRAPNAAANDARAASSARAAVLPGWCTLAGLA